MRKDEIEVDFVLFVFARIAYNFNVMQNLAIKLPSPRHMPISVEVYHLMAQRGAFHPDERVELVGGRIFDMSPVGSVHARCVKFLNAFFSAQAGRRFIVSVQDPIILDDESEPQPDIAVLRHVDDYYKNELPHAKDVLLIVEVADTSVDFDRSVKLQRYAQAGIPEAWLIDLINDRVEIHYAPEKSGYDRSKIYQRGENASSETMPGITLPAGDILG